MANKKFSVTYFQILKEIFSRPGAKNLQVLAKKSKICDFKMLGIIPLPLETMQ